MSLRALTVVPVPGPGAEDVLLGADGTAYTGCADGTVHAVRDQGRRISRVGTTGGRPLGLEWLPDGRLLVCDAHQGLLAMRLEDGGVEVLAESAGGRPLLVCNNAAVAGDGTIWCSDRRGRWPIERWKADLIEDSCTGRLVRLRAGPEPGRWEPPELVLEGLSFANGVALAVDESFVVVAETGHRRLRRVWLSGDRAGSAEVFVEDLPCYPDNISTGSDGLVWVTFGSPRSLALSVVQALPTWMRSALARLPERLLPVPRRTARVAAYDADGRLVHDIECDASAWHLATGVREQHGRVWLGSLAQPALAWFAL